MHTIVDSSPIRHSEVMLVLYATLNMPTTWCHLMEDLILQNPHPIIEKCLNMRKNISKTDYRLISRRDHGGAGGVEQRHNGTGGADDRTDRTGVGQTTV